MGSVLTDTSYGSGFAPWMAATWTKSDVLRYGENPHQKAAVYRIGRQPEGGVAQGVQLHGKEMSYNNFIDADAAYRAAYDHGRSEAHTSELQSLMRISYAVFCLKQTNTPPQIT